MQVNPPVGQSSDEQGNTSKSQIQVPEVSADPGCNC